MRALFALPFPSLRVLYVYHVTEYPLEVLAANDSLGNLEELACWPHGLEPGDDAAHHAAGRAGTARGRRTCRNSGTSSSA